MSSNQKNSQKHPLLHYICVSHCFPTRIHHLSGFWVGKPFETYIFLTYFRLRYCSPSNLEQMHWTSSLNICKHVMQWVPANDSMTTSLIEATMIIFSYRIALGLFNKTSRKWAKADPQRIDIMLQHRYHYIMPIHDSYDHVSKCQVLKWHSPIRTLILGLTPPNDFCNQLQAIETNFYNAIPVAVIAFTIGSILPTPVQGDQRKIKDHLPDSLILPETKIARWK